MKKIAVILFILFLVPAVVYGKESKCHKYFERDYQKYWCEINNGTQEYRLPDKTRVDCVTDNYAIEFDFAKKWAEAVGQSLYYAEVLQKNPGIVLISENGEKDKKFINRLNFIAEKFGIKVWIITPENM